MTLTKSIYSHTTGKLYGAQYEPVMVIIAHDNVLIVEGVKGRFPVHCDHVTDELERIEPEPEKIRLRGEKRTHKNPPQKPQQNIIQNTLF